MFSTKLVIGEWDEIKEELSQQRGQERGCVVKYEESLFKNKSRHNAMLKRKLMFYFCSRMSHIFCHTCNKTSAYCWNDWYSFPHPAWAPFPSLAFIPLYLITLLSQRKTHDCISQPFSCCCSLSQQLGRCSFLQVVTNWLNSTSHLALLLQIRYFYCCSSTLPQSLLYFFFNALEF